MLVLTNARVIELIEKWKIYRGTVAEPVRYCKLKDDLYKVRNAGWNGNPPLSAWPAVLIDSDDKIMAAVEHYFLCRCWVGTGAFPSWQMRLMNNVYDIGKMLHVTPQHNPTKPTSPLTLDQMAAKEEGIRDGEKDLAKAGGKAPLIVKPPSYF